MSMQYRLSGAPPPAGVPKMIPAKPSGCDVKPAGGADGYGTVGSETLPGGPMKPSTEPPFPVPVMVISLDTPPRGPPGGGGPGVNSAQPADAPTTSTAMIATTAATQRRSTDGTVHRR